MKPILMRMGCVGMLLLAAGIVDGAGSRPYSSQAFWPLLLLAMGVAVGGMGLGVRAELLDPTPEYECENTESETKRPRGASAGASRGTKERTPADPAGICGATFEQSENGAASTLPPAGATTGQRGFAAGEMEPNGDKRWAAARSRTSMRRMRRRRPLQPGRRFKGHTKKFAFQA